jgi:hypothetical protein
MITNSIEDDSKVIEVASKFSLLVLLTQFGKTFVSVNKIISEISQDPEAGRSVHIVFSMNTLLNNAQFASRLDSVENEYGKGSVCVFASKYDGKYRHVKSIGELQGLCFDTLTCPSVIIMCSNTVRYENAVDFIKVLDRNKNFGFIKRVHCYYDELHKYISETVRSQIEETHNLEIVKGIMAMTASPDKIFKKEGFWSKLQLIYLSNFNQIDYAGVNDMIFNCIDDYFPNPYVRPGIFEFDLLDRDTVGFIKHVLKKHPELLNDGSRVFIPAHVRRVGHNSLRDLIFKLKDNSIVVVINGVEKTLQYKDLSTGCLKTLPLSVTKPVEEVCETISKLITLHKLQNRPLVITGFLCVGMGQTLTHKSLGSFTAAIFSHLDLTNDELYQLFGRITGRMKDWGAGIYIQTQVYCPTKVMQRCQVMEECARQMAIEHNGDVVTQEDYRQPMYELGSAGAATIENIRPVKEKKDKAVDTDKDYRVFDTLEEAIKFGKDVLNVKFHKRSNDAPKELRKKNKGNNPTPTMLVDRMWGIDENTKARMCITDEKKWCVYWRPSHHVK